MSEHTRRVVAQALTIILGLFFVLSGIGKLVDVASFSRTLAQYGAPLLSRLSITGSPAAALYEILAIAIPPLELLLGVGLLAGYQSRRLSAVALVMVSVFTAAFALMYFARGVEDCGCFGALTALNAGPIFSLIRNGLLAILAAVLAFGVFRRPGFRLRFSHGVLVLTMAATAFGVAGRTSQNPISISSERSWGGHAVSDTPLARFVDTSPDSTYLFFIYSPWCGTCWDAAENVKAYQRTGMADAVIGVTSAHRDAVEIFKEEVAANFRTLHVPREVITELITGYPVGIFVQADTVRYVQNGGIISPYSLRRSLERLARQEG